jgi:hypothetical protein
MKYLVTFQQLGKDRPIDHPSTADFEAYDSGMLPNVGDYVDVNPLEDENRPRYKGKVKSRLFQYQGHGNCHINIVIENADGDDWGALIESDF